ncbi:MAG: HD domain-containing protein [Prevotellaceae bacterium]|nr:HD domain-containing protein [Prevotellaceae bacterium]
MELQALIDRLTMAMIEFDKGDAMRIQHFLKVHRFAQLIGRSEHLDAHTQMILESAAVVHDIGIHPAEAKYGNSNGKLQEQEGPAPARKMLTALGYNNEDTERICYLIAHHHTYHPIDGMDYQILVEADFLVNFFEDNIPTSSISYTLEKIFKTATGKKIAQQMFLEKYERP